MIKNYTISLIIGPPGSGKTKELLDFKNSNNYSCETIGYSWILCSKIKGSTMYDLFHISPKTTFLSYGNINYIKQLTYIKYICVDEIFMFNSEMFDIFIECCNNLKNLTNIFLYGDYMQLKSYGEEFFKNFGIENIKIEKRMKLFRSIECKELQDKILHYYNHGSIDLKEFDNCKIDNFSKCVEYLRKGWIMCVGTNDRKKILTNKLEKFEGFYKLSDDKIYNKYAQVNTKLVNYSLYNGQIIKLLIDDINTSDDRIMIETDENERKLLIGKREKYKYSFPIEPIIFSTIHKLQGSTLEGIIIDLESLFEFNSFYTAISRVKNIDNIKIFYKNNFDNIKIETNYKLFDYFNKQN